MKRIVDGKTYNTDTATKVAGARIEGPDQDFTQQTLYVTRGGAFFIHQFERTFFFDQDAEPTRWHQDAESFIPLTRDEAQEWFLKGDVEIFNDIFEEPPEASGDQPPEPEATIYVRVPEPLKRRIGEAADEVNLSTNAWAMRCFEQYLGDVVKTQGLLAVALHDVQTIETTMECFTEKLVRQIARNAANSIEKALTLLGLDKDGQVALYESLATGGGGEFENWMGPEYRADHQ